MPAIFGRAISRQLMPLRRMPDADVDAIDADVTPLLRLAAASCRRAAIS
jgi:hypothetical protein